MTALNRSHQEGLFSPKKAGTVTVLGAGAVGSAAVLMLARLGVTSCTVYDADDVRSHNLPMGLAFRPKDLGRFKVEALAELVEEQAGLQITAIPRMYAGERLVGSVLSCVDTMEARKLIWEQVRMNPNVDLFVDTRTAKLFVSVYAIRPCFDEDVAYYDARLYPTSETVRQNCGNHGISYISAVAASMACRALTMKWSSGTPRRHERLLYGGDGTYLYASSSKGKAGRTC